MEEDIDSVSVKMEASLMKQGRGKLGQINEVRYVKRVVTKKKKKPHRGIKRPAPATLQKLVVSCRKIFKGAGTVPLPEDVRKICHILDNMKPEDVGLSKDRQFFNPKNMVRENPRVAYTTITKCDTFSLCIFFIPARGVIPLHNHPGMTVFSKLLLGQMHIKSYDWVDPEASNNLLQPSQLRLARLKADDAFTAPCDTSVLYPTTGGNIHEFTAITPCAVLDVIGPPYSKKDGRDCSYYRDHPYTFFSNGEGPATATQEESKAYGWLEEIEVPENFQLDGIGYSGPPIIEFTR